MWFAKEKPFTTTQYSKGTKKEIKFLMRNQLLRRPKRSNYLPQQHKSGNTHSHFNLLAHAREKCNNIFASSTNVQVIYLVRQFLHKLDSCEIEGNKGKGFESNLKYFIEFVFSDYLFNVDSHVKLINFDFKGERLKMELQGCIKLCSMCALHNTMKNFCLTDCLWFVLLTVFGWKWL